MDFEVNNYAIVLYYSSRIYVFDISRIGNDDLKCGDVMAGYILSILGIVVAGVFIDIIIPSGTISKYIKSIYAIFVLAVIITPIIKFFNNNQGFNLQYQEYEINQNLINYIQTNKIATIENDITLELENEGLFNIDIIINYSIDNNELSINSCTINLENLVISSDNQHINKYEIIKEIVREHTNLTDEEMIFYE